MFVWVFDRKHGIHLFVRVYSFPPSSHTSENIYSWSKSYTTLDIKYRFPTREVNLAKPLPSTLLGHHSLGLEVKGHSLLMFAVQGHDFRDIIIKRINAARDKSLSTSHVPSLPRMESIDIAGLDKKLFQASLEALSESTTITSTPQVASPKAISTPPDDDEDPRGILATATLAPISHTLNLIRSFEIPSEAFALLPRPVNLPHDLLRGMKSRHFICLSIGSRGDVQYVRI